MTASRLNSALTVARVALALLAVAPLGSSQSWAWPEGLAPSSSIPAEAWLGPDWYPVRRESGVRLRTNHTLAELGLRFRASTTIGVRFACDHLEDAELAPGTCGWRLWTDGVAGPWRHAHPLMRPRLAADLDPKRTYALQLRIEHVLDPRLDPFVLQRVERWRDGVGRQGCFVEFEGFALDAGAVVLPWASPARPYLDYVVYGDSLADGWVLEPNGGPVEGVPWTLNEKGAAACWPAKALEEACARLSPPRTPRGINHAFGGWWGCRLAFPYGEHGTARELSAAEPWRLPSFPEMLDRCHPTAPRFGIERVDLVLYALNQNDLGTRRLLDPNAYQADIVENVRILRKTWPGARILMTSTHVSDKPSGLTQQVLMEAALTSPALDHRQDPTLHFVSPTRILHDQSVFPQPSHPPEKIHDVWGLWIGLEIVKLLEGKAVAAPR